MPPQRATGRADARPAFRASRVGYSDRDRRPAHQPRPRARGDTVLPISPKREAECSEPVTSKPDFVAQEYEILALWRERRTFERLRAQNADGPRWSFLDGPITANNPMGVHHAWGRAYKDLFQRFHAMLGEDQRYQNGFDCQGLWVEVNVERDLGFTSKRDIEAFGIAEFVSLCKQRVLTYAARQTEQSIRLGMWMDWNDPARAAPAAASSSAADPAAGHDHPGTERPGHRHASRCSSAGSGCRTRAAATSRSATRTTTSSGASSPSATGAAGCTRATTRCRGAPRCGTGISQIEMNEGYQDREDPGLTVRFPLVDRPGRGAPRLDDDALDADLERRRRGRAADLRYVRVRQGDDDVLAREGHAQGRARRAVRGARGADRFASSSAGATRVRSTTCRRSGTRSPRARATTPATRTSIGSWPGPRSARTRAPGSSTSRPGCGAEDFQLGRDLGLPVIAPLDESGMLPRRVRAAVGP